MTQYTPCPKCNDTQPQAVKFTAWGGVLGPRLFSQVRCAKCGYNYNGKTGKSLTTGKLIYFGVIGFAAFVLMFLIFFTIAFVKMAK
jgi:hypothetical protein